MNELALFAGAGGGILGGKLLGWRTVCAVERDAYAAQVLAQRQNDGMLDPFPIWSDVCSFDGRPWRGLVDIVSGGFPCQDISAAGKGAGIDGQRSGLWSEFARIIGEVRPRFVFVENSPMLVGRGLGRVLGDLATLGFDAEWGVMGADDAGAPHIRKRIWILAHAQGCGWGTRRDEPHADNPPEEGNGQGQPIGVRPGNVSDLANPAGPRLPSGQSGACGPVRDQARGPEPERRGRHVAHPNRGNEHGGRRPLQVGGQRGTGQAPDHGHTGRIEWLPEPPVGRLANGVAHRVEQLRALGNGQVPSVAALAFTTLYRRLTEN
jgi:DNA (cytosine-5)-methyltransferase 1